MGECACGDIGAREGFRVGENVLVVEVYPGCVSCDTGVQVHVHLFTPAEASRYDIEVKGDFAPGLQGWSRLVFPVVGADDLAEAARGLDGEWGFGEHHGPLGDMLADKWRRILERALAVSKRKGVGAES